MCEELQSGNATLSISFQVTEQVLKKNKFIKNLTQSFKKGNFKLTACWTAGSGGTLPCTSNQAWKGKKKLADLVVVSK